MRAVLYARLSRATATNEKTIDAQLEGMRRLAYGRGWTVVAELHERGESAYGRDEPEDRAVYGEVLDLIRSGAVDIVVADHPDRLWRDDVERGMFWRDAKKAGLQMVATTSGGDYDPASPEDDFTLSLLTAVAKKESADKSRRLRAKHRQLAAAGRRAGGGDRQFGFTDDHTAVVEPEAAVIREMAAILLSGGTLGEAARVAERSGLRTTAGGAWTRHKVRRLVTSAAISGMREHPDVGPVKAVWPAILEWSDVQRLREELDSRITPRRPNGEYLLSGIATCGSCGATLVSQGRGDQPAYRCPQRPGACGQLKIRGDWADADVERQFLACLKAYRLPEPARSDRVAIEARVTRAAQKLARLEDALIDGDLTREAYRRQRARVEAERDEALQELGTVAEHVDPKSVMARWAAMTVGQRKSALQALTRRVTVRPGLRGRNTRDPSRVVVVPTWPVLLEFAARDDH